MKFRHYLSLAGAVLVAGALVACSGNKEENASGKTGTTPPAADAAVMAKLEAADAFDGNVDKVVSKCLGCGLKMDGNPANTVEAHGYTLDLCDKCKDGIDDVDGKLAALTIPDKN